MFKLRKKNNISCDRYREDVSIVSYLNSKYNLNCNACVSYLGDKKYLDLFTYNIDDNLYNEILIDLSYKYMIDSLEVVQCSS